MAQPIYCDMQGCQDPDAPRPRIAVWMVQRLDGSLVEAYCNDHFPFAAVAYADNAAQEAGTSLAALMQPPEPGPDDPTDSDEPEVAEPATFQDAPAAQEPAQEPGQAAEGATTPEAAIPAVLEAPSGPTVIRKGTSPSRRAHEARKRARSRKAAAPEPELVPTETDPGDGSTGP